MYSYGRRPYNPNYATDRQFIVPFLLGGLAGGAAVGLTRPRPIYNVAPQGNYGYRPPYPYNAPYAYNSYGGYIPYHY